MVKTNHFGALAAVAAGVFAAVGMLTLTMLLALVEPAEAAFPGQNGKIAFTSNRAGNPEIYTMNSTGQVLDRLTNDPKGDSQPAWSPGGNKIAFTSNRAGNFDIYAMKANGTGLERITNDPQGDYEPAWSPDGKRIVFTSTRADNYEIYTMDPGGMSLFRRTNSIQSDFSPDWQPLSPPDNDTTPPKVISTSPKANAKAVAPTVNIKATFSEDMMASTINKSTFKLSKKGSTTKVSAAVSYSAATDKATLNPTEALRKGATYKAVVTTGAKDAAGNPLDQNTAKAGLQQKRWVFTVKKK